MLLLSPVKPVFLQPQLEAGAARTVVVAGGPPLPIPRGITREEEEHNGRGGVVPLTIVGGA